MLGLLIARMTSGIFIQYGTISQAAQQLCLLYVLRAFFPGLAAQPELIVMSFELEKSESRNIYVTTIGRVSGLAREIEIWFVTLDGKFHHGGELSGALDSQHRA